MLTKDLSISFLLFPMLKVIVMIMKKMKNPPFCPQVVYVVGTDAYVHANIQEIYIILTS